MADVTDPSILEAYNDVRDDKTETNWLIIEYVDEKSNKMHLSSTGKGGLSECVDTFKADQAAFAYVRLNVSNDPLSTRSKFILISWCGPEVKVMRKAKLSVHISDVKAVLKSFAVEISAGDKNELKENDVLLLVKKAMGANYDRQSTNY